MVDDDDDANDARVERLLEQILESGDSPEEACRACPELLPEVRAALRQLRQLEEDVSALFPPSSDGDSQPPDFGLPEELPVVPGYQVMGVLGRGGMGIVFHARHLRLNRPVALKMILAGEFALPTQRQRFLREAEAIAAISHPNIVQVHNAGESDGLPWFTMELMEGGNLTGKIGGAPQPARQSAALVADIAGAIAVAHHHGIVHRDLKPGNILLTADGTPKVTDFGLALWSDEAGTTLTGSPVGTASYMAPEQARGASREIGPATDVYALGAILYELLTGRPPFRGETSSATIQQVLTNDVVPPRRLNPRVPRDLETICLKCLRKEASRRYPGAAELADDLRRFLSGEPISARPVGTFERAVLWLRRHPAAATAFAAALVLAVTLAATGAWWFRDRAAAELDAKVELRQAEQYRQNADYANAAAALDRAKRRLGGIGAAALRATLDRESATVELLGQLDEIRLDRALVAGKTGIENALLEPQKDDAKPGRMPRRTEAPSARYAKVFRAAGIGSSGEDPAEVAARLRASPGRDSLVAALDDWAACATNPQHQSWILSVLKYADADPWRNRVRDAASGHDGDALQKLADEAPVAEQPPQILVLLAARLRAANRDARPLMNRVVLAHPTDFWANVEMGTAVYQDDPREALGYYRTALAIRPRLAIMYDSIGFMYSQQERWKEAFAYFRKSIELEPGDAVSHCNYAFALCWDGRLDDAVVQAREALRCDPTYDLARDALSFIHMRQQRFPEALEEARTFARLARPQYLRLARSRVLELLLLMGRDPEARDAWRETLAANPPDHDARFGYAELCLFLGDQDGYRRERTALLKRFGDSGDPVTCERTAKACLLLDGDPAELNAADALADHAAAKEPPSDIGYPHALFARGLAAYRLGRLDDAITIMKGKAASVAGPCPKLVVAMALYKKGEIDEARKLLSTTLRTSDWSRKMGAGEREPYWVAQILRREAEALVQPQVQHNATSRPASTSPAEEGSPPSFFTRRPFVCQFFLGRLQLDTSVHLAEK
jgi:tetratricopeptide (TPR) repeat protein